MLDEVLYTPKSNPTEQGKRNKSEQLAPPRTCNKPWSEAVCGLKIEIGGVLSNILTT